MRNHYTRGSEAAIAANMFEEPLRQLTDAAEESCDMIESMENELEEKDQEIKDLNEEVEGLESTIRDLQKRLEAGNINAMITVLKNIILYCQTTLEKIQPEEPDDQRKQEGPQEDNA